MYSTIVCSIIFIQATLLEVCVLLLFAPFKMILVLCVHSSVQGCQLKVENAAQTHIQNVLLVSPPALPVGTSSLEGFRVQGLGAPVLQAL